MPVSTFGGCACRGAGGRARKCAVELESEHRDLDPWRRAGRAWSPQAGPSTTTHAGAAQPQAPLQVVTQIAWAPARRAGAPARPR
jgi:hypothetical protein